MLCVCVLCTYISHQMWIRLWIIPKKQFLSVIGGLVGFFNQKNYSITNPHNLFQCSLHCVVFKALFSSWKCFSHKGERGGSLTFTININASVIKYFNIPTNYFFYFLPILSPLLPCSDIKSPFTLFWYKTTLFFIEFQWCNINWFCLLSNCSNDQLDHFFDAILNT